MNYNKLIYICSPLRGNIEENIKKANAYSRYAYEQGYVPIAPHVMFSQFLNDTVDEERKNGMLMGQTLLDYCDEVWVFEERISEGMTAEIESAEFLGIKVRYFKETMEER